MGTKRSQEILRGLGLKHSRDNRDGSAVSGIPIVQNRCERLACRGVVTAIKPKFDTFGQSINERPPDKALHSRRPFRVAQSALVGVLGRPQRP